MDARRRFKLSMRLRNVRGAMTDHVLAYRATLKAARDELAGWRATEDLRGRALFWITDRERIVLVHCEGNTPGSDQWTGSTGGMGAEHPIKADGGRTVPLDSANVVRALGRGRPRTQG